VGTPFPTRCGEDAGTEREGAREQLGGSGGGEIYSMGEEEGERRRKRTSALRVYHAPPTHHEAVFWTRSHLLGAQWFC
jgi:hypothetical protein